MKNIKYIVLILSGFFLQGCWDDEVFPGGGETTPVNLEINVTDATTSAPVSGATVQLYTSPDGYVEETGSVATKTTDANGNVVFTREELGDPGAKYINVIAGEMRNWSSVVSTPAMTMTSGTTLIKTKVAAVLPEFIALAGNRFALTAYDYPVTGNVLPSLEACRGDDEFVFLKTGRLFAYDAGEACDPHFKGYTAQGIDWSSWTIIDDGAGINMKDLDPDWLNNNTYNAGLSISSDGNVVTIDYGGGYVATLTKL